VCNLVVSYLVTRQKGKLFDREELQKAALRALGLRAHSTNELREKLRRRGREEDVEAVIASLKQAGYLDDRRFAENYAAARLDNQMGKMRVLRDLRQRRVAPQLAQKVTEETYQNTDETQLIEDFLKRKYRGKQLPVFLGDEKNLAAAYRRLRYAGFSARGSIAVLKRVSRAGEILETLESEDSGPAEDV
jgi:regulatory protein